MGLKIQKIIIIISILIVTMGFVNYAQTQQNFLFISDVLNNAQKYFNLQVTFQGKVTDVTNAANAQTRGFYFIIDNSDRSIKVVANDLPAPNQKITVTGIVQLDTKTQTPYIREISKFNSGVSNNTQSQPSSQKEDSNIMLFALIGLIVVVVLILIIVLLKKPNNAAPENVVNRAKKPEQPQAVNPEDQKTTQVSVEEINKQAGGMKTQQVPNLLAELQVLSGSLMGENFTLGYETLIGKVSGDIALEDSSVSRKQAKITFSNNAYVLENLSQTNQTIINGKKISGTKELKKNDEIIMGIIKMKFNLI